MRKTEVLTKFPKHMVIWEDGEFLAASRSDTKVTVRRNEDYYFFQQVDPPSREQLQRVYRDQNYWTRHEEFLRTERESQFYWRRIYADWCAIVKKHLYWTSHKPKWVDIGSGQGFLTWWASVEGFRTTGIDPSGMNGAIQKFFPDDESMRMLRGIRPDVISAILVLEHIHDPLEFLAACGSVLWEQSGLLLLKVPNDFSQHQKEVLEDHGLYWLDPLHINYFQPRTLKQILNLCGFEVVESWFTFPMEWFLMAGWDYVADPSKGWRAHQLRMYLEVTMGQRLRNWLRRRRNKLNYGREIVVLARAVDPPHISLQEYDWSEGHAN